MYKKTTLQNGITVVTDSIPYFPAVSMGLWWKTGGRYENQVNNGISHFIEHMLFKGTKRRTAHEIAREIDAVGGSMNAFTGKEYTCLYARVLKKDMDIALDVLSDMYKHSLFNSDDMEKEKYVIGQEIKMVEDSPEEYIYDAFNLSFFKDHPLGMSILGKEENIQGFDRESLLVYFHDFYCPNNLVITATGRIDHEKFVYKIDKLFRDIERNETFSLPTEVPICHKSINTYDRDLEHIYLCIGTRGASQIDKRRYCLYVLNAIIGGSMSSHLFQEVREKRGLVYNIYSYVSCYRDMGTFGISTSTSVESIEDVLRLVKEELLKIRDNGITDAELAFSKEHIKGNLFISLESSEARMGRLAKNEIYFDRYIPFRETIREIDGIRKPDVDRIAQEIFENPGEMPIALLGKIDEEKAFKIWKS